MHLFCDLGVDPDPLCHVIVRIRFHECLGDKRHFDSAAKSTPGQAGVLRAARPVKRQAVVVSASLCVHQVIGTVDDGGPEYAGVVDDLYLGLDSDVLPVTGNRLLDLLRESGDGQERVFKSVRETRHGKVLFRLLGVERYLPLVFELGKARDEHGDVVGLCLSSEQCVVDQIAVIRHRHRPTDQSGLFHVVHAIGVVRVLVGAHVLPGTADPGQVRLVAGKIPRLQRFFGVYSLGLPVVSAEYHHLFLTGVCRDPDEPAFCEVFPVGQNQVGAVYFTGQHHCLAGGSFRYLDVDDLVDHRRLAVVVLHCVGNDAFVIPVLDCLERTGADDVFEHPVAALFVKGFLGEDLHRLALTV